MGYVPTDYAIGSITLFQAERWVDQYYSWYGTDGILFDEASDSCSPGPFGFYMELYQSVKSEPGSPFVVLNPGKTTGECYASISDLLVTFEGSYSQYVSSYRAAGWMANYSPTRFWNVVHGLANVDEMNTVLSLAAQRGLGWVYVTDGPSASPYGQLPSYFMQMLDSVSRSSVVRGWQPPGLPPVPTFSGWDTTHCRL